MADPVEKEETLLSYGLALSDALVAIFVVAKGSVRRVPKLIRIGWSYESKLGLV